jgi:hypothetical protein
MSQDKRALAWDHGVTSVESLGGMLGATSFVLPDGRQVAPFQIAPWANEAGSEALPGILQRLRGEWPCVPFGSDADRAPMGDWPGSHSAGTVDSSPHGFGSNNNWTFVEGGSGIALSIAYPDGHPIASLERRVTPDANAAAIDFELVTNVRQDCELPLGLHPCFRVPAKPGAMRIEVGADVSGATFPIATDASSIFAQDQFLPRWNDVPLLDGSRLDVSRLPLPYNTEELLQLIDMPGHAALWNSAEGYRVRLKWNREHFPSALLWFTNRGRTMSPWNGRHLALGLEPICSAFDLGQQISAADNPISRRGVATTRKFTAGERFVTRYRVEVEPAEIV